MSDVYEQLREILESLELDHSESGDPWYSCPKHPSCCNGKYDSLPLAERPCLCGADEHNARVAQALGLLVYLAAASATSNPMYVVLNAARPYDYSFGRPGEYHIMPYEDPHTYGALDEAAEQVVTLMAECDHTIETAPIYCLVPVPRTVVVEAVARAQARAAEEEG